MKNSSKILFLLILMMGTMISISSNSWLGAWMGLEINLLAFIPIMTNTNNLMSSEAALKYFLTQALASSVLLFSVMMSLIKMNTYIDESWYLKLSNMVIISSLLMKSGAAPFHFWFPSVMEGLNWMNSLFLMTWQKIAPLMLMSYLIIKPIMYTTIILSVMIGSLGGLNQTSLRKLMSFSSINHLGWMIAAMLSGENLWTLYFIIYTMLSFNVIFMFSSTNTLHMNQLFSSFSYSKSLKFILFINLLSLGGLPPFMGFMPKWMVIQSMTLNNQLMIMVLMTVMTMLTLFYYIRICYSAFMLNYYEPNWMTNMNYKNMTMNSLMIMSFISMFMLFSVNLMYFVM